MPPTSTTSSISAGLERCVAKGCLAWPDRLLKEVVHQALKLGARELHGEMLGPALVRGDERQVDLGLLGARQLDLGLFGGFLQTLQRKLVLAQVDAVLSAELACEVIDKPHVEVFAAKERVAVGGLNLEDAVADFQDRNIEGAAAEVVNRDGLGLFLLVEAVGQRCRRGLVDDAQNLKPRDLARVLGCLALGVVEVSWNGDDRFLHLLAEISFGGFLHLLQNEGGDLRRRVFLAVAFDPGVAIVAANDLIGHEAHVLFHHLVVPAAADQALDGEEGVFGIGNGLALRGQADQTLAVGGEGHHGRCRAHAFRVFNNFGMATFHDGHARISRAQVNANHFRHRSEPRAAHPSCETSFSWQPAAPVFRLRDVRPAPRWLSRIFDDIGERCWARKHHGRICYGRSVFTNKILQTFGTWRTASLPALSEFSSRRPASPRRPRRACNRTPFRLRRMRRR